MREQVACPQMLTLVGGDPAETDLRLFAHIAVSDETQEKLTGGFGAPCAQIEGEGVEDGGVAGVDQTVGSASTARSRSGGISGWAVQSYWGFMKWRVWSAPATCRGAADFR